MKKKYSQCSCCGKTFVIKEEEKVLYCKDHCEKKHDLFILSED